MVSPVFIKPLLAVVVTTAFIGIVAAIYRNDSHDRLPVQSALQKLPRNIDIALKKARFSEMRDGSVVWELVAENVEYDKRGEVAHLSGIRMDFVRSGTYGAIAVTAERGKYFSNNNNIQLSGKVHVETENGIVFDTDSIEYKALESRFKTADKVLFRQQRLTLAAVGLELDVKEQRARFKNVVDATVAGTKIQAAVSKPAIKKTARPLKNQLIKKVKKRRKGKNR
jgi:LPS export ABC transporter protein LptC